MGEILFFARDEMYAGVITAVLFLLNPDDFAYNAVLIKEAVFIYFSAQFKHAFIERQPDHVFDLDAIADIA